MSRRKNDEPPPPAHLAPETAAWWSSIVREYELDEHHYRLLQGACEAWDRTQQARQILATAGLTYNDRFGAPRSRPEVAIERDSRTAFARLVRELGLDHVPPPEAPRPPLGRNYTRR